MVPAVARSPFSLEGKTAIVTGGGTGIGQAIALEFARAGADVAVCSRKMEHLEPVAEAVRRLGRRTFAMVADVRNEPDVQAVVERAAAEFGRLDVMVNNAGASFRARPEDISVNGWNAVVGINLTGVFLGCKWAQRQMVKQGSGGVIINVASIAGVYGSTMMAHYGAAKAAVINLTRAVAIELAPFRIRVNAICPGAILTPLLHRGNADAMRPLLEKFQPWPAAGLPEHIAAAALFLASDEAEFVTGEALVVDGGATARGSNAIAGLGGEYGRVAVGVDRGTTGQDPEVRPLD